MPAHPFIRRPAAPIDAAQLDQFEAQIGLSLPREYRAFLLETNGGLPRRTIFSHFNSKGKKRTTLLLWLFTLGHEGLVEREFFDLATALADRPVGLPEWVIPVGEAEFDINTGRVYLGCAGDALGKVFFRPEVDAKKPTLYPVADSWGEFLANLKYDTKPKPWLEAIWDADIDAFRDWLDNNRRKWQFLGGNQVEIMRGVIDENFWPGVELLHERGVSKAWLFEEAMDANRFEIARDLLQLGGVPLDCIQRAVTSGSPFLYHLPTFLEQLLQLNIDPDHEDDDGNTALHHATECRALDAVKILLALGADPTIKNIDDRTPAGVARRLEETQLTAILQDAELAWKNRPVVAEPLTRPFDLCGIAFLTHGPALTIEQIQTFEKTLDFELTPEYRWLLLEHNGGAITPNLLPVSMDFSREPDEYHDIDDDDDEYHDDDDSVDDEAIPALGFFPLFNRHKLKPISGAPRRPASDDDDTYDSTVEDSVGGQHNGYEIPRGTVPIGGVNNFGLDGSGVLLLHCKGRSRGTLSLFDNDATPLDLTLPKLFQMMSELGKQPATPTDRFADAIDAKDMTAIQALLAERATLSTNSRDGRMPLRAACEAGFNAAVVAVAQAGALPFEDCLREAANAGQSELVGQLLSLDLPLEKDNIRELLGSAAIYQSVSLFEQVVARGRFKLEKLLRGKFTESILAAAVQAGQPEVLELLRTHGLDLTHRDAVGRTALHYLFWGHGIDRAAILKTLLTLGVPSNTPDNEGETALHRAIHAADLGAVKVLLDAGESMDATFELRPDGMGADPEKAAKQAAKMVKMIERQFGKIAKDLDPGADADDEPVIDTSEIVGEKTANMLEELHAAQHKMASMIGSLGEVMNQRIASLAAGSWGTGISARELAERLKLQHPEFHAELSAYLENPTP